MSARTLDLGGGEPGETELPEGYAIEQRLDDRSEPATITFDVFRGDRRLAWGLRTRDAAVRWVWRLAGAPRRAPVTAVVAAPMAVAGRRRGGAAPWWAQAS